MSLETPNGDQDPSDRVRPIRARIATEEEVEALERSIEHEDLFDRHVGRLVRSMTILENLVDDFLLEHFFQPWGNAIFWTRYLQHRGLNQKADDVRQLTDLFPNRERDSYRSLLQSVKDLARQRNQLVHGLINVQLPIGKGDTSFTVLRREPESDESFTTTTREMSELVDKVDSVIAEWLDLIEDPEAW